MEVAATAGARRRAMASGAVERGRTPRMTRGRAAAGAERRADDEALREPEEALVRGRRRENMRAARWQEADMAADETGGCGCGGRRGDGAGMARG